MAITLDGSNVNTVGVINSKTAVASTSGTSIDFTGIPAGVKRITVMFDGVSLSGTSPLKVQIGDSGGIETSGYTGMAYSPATNYLHHSDGFSLAAISTAALLWSGSITLTNITGNQWTESGNICSSALSYGGFSAGSKTLSATLDRIRITTVNGTDTFDAGSINILYE
jgi:hypothetical protein